MEERQAPPIAPEGSSESVHWQDPMHALDEHEQFPEQPQPPQAPFPPFMQEFMQAIRHMAHRPNEGALDENFEKIRKQGAKVFTGTTDPMVAEEWLRSTERVLDRFECTTEKRVSYAASLFEQDALDWWDTVPRSRDVPMMITWAVFLRAFTDKYISAVYKEKKKLEFLNLK